MKLTPALLPHLIEAIVDVIEKNAEKVIVIVPVVINELNYFKAELARIYSDE